MKYVNLFYALNGISFTLNDIDTQVVVLVCKIHTKIYIVIHSNLLYPYYCLSLRKDTKF